MRIPEKGVTYRASRRAYIGNYFIAIIFLVFLVLVYFRFDLSFTLFPRSFEQMYRSLAILLLLLPVAFLSEEPIIEGVVRRYVITNDEIIKVEGVLRKKRIVIPFANVADVSIKKSVFGRLFNYGDVEVTGLKEPIRMKAMINPELIQRIIQNKINLFRRRVLSKRAIERSDE